MDCIYKTNRYNMALYNRLGITYLKIMCYLAFIFLKSKNNKDYFFIIISLRKLYIKFNLLDFTIIIYN